MTANRELDEQERAAVRTLYEPLRRFAAVVSPIEIDPDDLVQEALLQVLRRGTLSELDEPLAYLRRTVINLASNHRRHLGITRRALERLGATGAPQTAAAYPSDLADLLTLTPEERTILYLAEVEGYTYGEISRMVGCSEATARKRASRGRSRLRQVLTGETT